MSKPSLTLQPRKGVVTQAAAQVFAAYVVAGRVKDNERDDWMKRAIREVFAIARAVDSSFYSDGEMPPEEQPVIEPPPEQRSVILRRSVNDDTVLGSQVVDGFPCTVDGWVRNNCLATPAGRVRVDHSVKVEANGPATPPDAMLRGQGSWDKPQRQDLVDCIMSRQPLVFGPRLRKTFATELIEGGADPKSVQELLGHRTLEITMKLYAKLRRGTKRQAIGRLSYGAGASAPEHVLEFPERHKTVTTGRRPETADAQGVGGQ